MKKLQATIVLMALAILSFAGEPVSKNFITSEGGHCFDESTHIINVGVGFGGADYYRGYRGVGWAYRRTPAFSLSYEQPWSERVGPGFIGIGGYAGFQSTYSRYSYDYYHTGSKYYYDNRWNNFFIAARAAYHWDELNLSNAELYGGLMLGLRFSTYHYETNDPGPYNNSNNWTGRSTYLVFSGFVGGRWYFVDNVALFGELGYGISYGTVGLSFKF